MAEERKRTRSNGRREETRRALLEAASRLFAEQGYHATSVPEIVRAAGVGHGTFYEYFKSRHDILLAITDQAGAAARRRPDLADRALGERVRADIYWYLLDFVEHLELSKVWHDASRFDPDIAATVRQARARRTEQVQAGIEALGPLPGRDPAIAAAALTAMVEEFANRWFVEGDGPGTSAADVVVAAETLSAIWLAATGLDGREPGGAPGPAGNGSTARPAAPAAPAGNGVNGG